MEGKDVSSEGKEGSSGGKKESSKGQGGKEWSSRQERTKDEEESRPLEEGRGGGTRGAHRGKEKVPTREKEAKREIEIYRYRYR